MVHERSFFSSRSEDCLWKNYYFKQFPGAEIEKIKRFVIFRGAMRSISVLFFNTNDELFGFGYNGKDFNVLGVTGSSFRRDSVERPTKIDLLSGKRITRMSVGGCVCAALDEQRNLYWWGKDLNKVNEVRLPGIAAPGHKFITVSCGAEVMAALDTTGSVYIWGKDLEMERLQIEQPVKHLSAGFYHIAMLAENGRVYTWGDGVEGQRGYESYTKADNDLVKQMDLDQECTYVVCGTYNTMCITVSGELWACGGNGMWCGCLGVAHDRRNVDVPEKVQVPGQVSLVTASFHYFQQTIFIALTSEGLYWWCERPYMDNFLGPTIADFLLATESPRDHIIHVSEPSNPRMSNLYDRCLADIPYPLAVSILNRLEGLNEILLSSPDVASNNNVHCGMNESNK